MNNAYNDPTSYRNISNAISTGLNISENQFITKDTYYSPQDYDEDTSNKFHYINFEIPIFEFDIEFEKPIDNDISAYDELKSKSNHYDNFLITYPNFKNYYRIYCFNVARNIRDDHNNKFINIITNMETTPCIVYIVLKTYRSVKLEYSKSNGLVVYKSQ